MKLHVYFASKFLRNLAGVFAAFLTFLILVDLVDQIRRFDFGVISFRQAFGLALLNAPRLIYNLLPLIVMLATLSLYLSLARTSELVVSRAAGRSALRSLSAPILAALATGLLTIAVFNPLVAATSKQYEATQAAYKNTQGSVLSVSREGLWLRQGDGETQMVIRAARANLDGTALMDVSFMAFDSSGTALYRIDAAEAELLEGAWQITDAKEWPLSPAISNPEQASKQHETLRLETDLTRDRIRDSFGEPAAIPIWDLPAFIEALNLAGFSAKRHLVWFHMELAQPAFLVAMVMVAAGFTMRHTRFGHTGQMVMAAFGLGLALYFMRSFAQVLGENGQLPVALAAWIPPVTGILLSLGLLLHFEDG